MLADRPGKWITILVTFLLKTAATDSDNASSLAVDRMVVVTASCTSITVEAHMLCGEHCMQHTIIWQYAEGDGLFVHTSDWERFEMWSGAGGMHRKEIADLKPNTRYRIRALIQSWKKTEAPLESPLVVANTCPCVPQNVSDLNVEEMPKNWHKVSWREPEELCASTSYFVRLVGVDSGLLLNHTCLHGGKFLGNTSSFRCEDRPNYICYLLAPDDIEHLSESFVQVQTTDASGVCNNGVIEIFNFNQSPTVYHGNLSNHPFHWVESFLLVFFTILFISLFSM